MTQHRSPAGMQQRSHRSAETFLGALYAAADATQKPGMSGTIYALSEPQGVEPATTVTCLPKLARLTFCEDSIDNFMTIIVERTSERGSKWKTLFFPATYAESTIIETDND